MPARDELMQCTFGLTFGCQGFADAIKTSHAVRIHAVSSDAVGFMQSEIMQLAVMFSLCIGTETH